MSGQPKPSLRPPPPSSAAVSAVMRGNRGRNTKPELSVRRLLFAKGYRYRIHPKGLPGRPDIAFIRRKKAILVHGCFWHQHKNCSKQAMPKVNTEYWRPKLQRNVEKQEQDIKSLRKSGWKVYKIWECQTKNEQNLTKKLLKIL